jgi:hypothetical protein
MSVFEALLSTMDAKLRRVENLDKAVEHLMRKMETLYSRVDRNIEKTEQVLSKLRAFDTKLYNVGNGKVVENLDLRLISLDEKVQSIDSKISALADNNYKGRIKKSSPNNAAEEFLKGAASERKTVEVTSTEEQSSPQAPVVVEAVNTQVSDDLKAVKDVIGRIDSKLSALTGVVLPKLGYLVTSVSDIHSAIIEEGPFNQVSFWIIRLCINGREVNCITQQHDMTSYIDHFQGIETPGFSLFCLLPSVYMLKDFFP